VSPARRLIDLGRHLHAVLGGPGLLIGGFSVVSFGFGLFVLAREYDRPRQTGRGAVHRVVGHWVRIPDYLGQTLVDYADAWRAAPTGERVMRQESLRQALVSLGGQLDRQGERFPLVHVVAMDLASPGSPPLARWNAPIPSGSPETEVGDTLTLLDGEGEGASAVTLRVRYRVAPALEAAARGLETSYRRLLLALLGLSGYSLLCLVYMVLHAQSLSRRVAREAAQEATLDLADRTCHELGNGIFVLANERRNLTEHLDLIDRFVAEDPQARATAAARAGFDPEAAARWDHALRREYAARGIDPALELRGSAAIARHVCRQIDAGTEYIRMTVRELDGFLKRSALPVEIAPVDVSGCFDEAVALLRPRLDAAEVGVVRGAGGEECLVARGDRRILIHALVNLLKNAVEAASASDSSTSPEITLSARASGESVELTVADNGPGIAPEARKRIFDFGVSTKGPGRGRGLAIVRETVHVQGGDITVGERPGGGAEFRITLPRDPGPACPPASAGHA